MHALIVNCSMLHLSLYDKYHTEMFTSGKSFKGINVYEIWLVFECIFCSDTVGIVRFLPFDFKDAFLWKRKSTYHLKETKFYCVGYLFLKIVLVSIKSIMWNLLPVT